MFGWDRSKRRCSLNPNLGHPNAPNRHWYKSVHDAWGSLFEREIIIILVKEKDQWLIKGTLLFFFFCNERDYIGDLEKSRFGKFFEKGERRWPADVGWGKAVRVLLGMAGLQLDWQDGSNDPPSNSATALVVIYTSLFPCGRSQKLMRKIPPPICSPAWLGQNSSAPSTSRPEIHSYHVIFTSLSNLPISYVSL